MTALAVLLALLGALLLAVAATQQHRAVEAVRTGGRAAPGHTAAAGGHSAGQTAAGHTTAPAPDGLSARGLAAVVRRPRWLAGLAFGAAGAGLHLLALALAPLPVVQPLGVLAVPMAVLLAGRARPRPGVLAGVALTVAGVAVFVAVSAGAPAGEGTVPTGFVTDAGLAVAAAAAALVVLTRRRPGWVRSLACAAAAATAFGYASVLLRAASQLLGTLDVVAPLAAAAVALLAGGWLVQQSFAAGPPEPVVACLTVVDPIVAVGLAMAVLGEGRTDAPLTAAAAAAAATAGVLVLARHHPDAADRRRPPTSPHQVAPERTSR